VYWLVEIFFFLLYFNNNWIGVLHMSSILLLPRFKTSRLVQLDKDFGEGPSNWLPLRLRVMKVILEKNDIHWERERLFRFWNFEKSLKLTKRLKLFEDRHKLVRFTRLKRDSGIFPCNMLLHKNIYSKECEEIAVLMCLVNWLFDRSKYTKDGKDTDQEGIVPFNVLLLSHNAVRFERSVILLGR